MKTLCAVLVASLFAVTQATKGVDVSTLQSVATWQCIKNAGYQFAIPRAYKSFGAMDANGPANVKNARAAGIPYVDIYMFPCRGKSATAQVNELINGMGNSNYGQIWLDVETNPSSGCSWNSFSKASNCQFVTELVNAVKAKGKKPGIYSNYYMWESIMGSAKACPGVANVPLWYAHYDNLAAFSDFKPFGGWTKPNMKQYKGDTVACGAGVDLNFY